MKRLSPVTFTSATYRLKRDSRFSGRIGYPPDDLALGASRLILTTDLLNFLFASRCQRARERDLQLSAPIRRPRRRDEPRTRTELS